jgi:transposase
VLLDTIPGVAELLASTIAVEIGDLSRLRLPAHLVSYGRLAPRVHQSGQARARSGPLSKSGSRLPGWAAVEAAQHAGRETDGKARLGHISGQGSPALRWALVEAAQHAPTGGGPLRQSYERIAKRRGKQVAKVAVARKILTLCYYGLRDAEIRCLAPRAKARTIRTTAVTP